MPFRESTVIGPDDSERSKLAGKRVLITGGSSGIGLALARQLAQADARLVLIARGEDGLGDAARQLPGSVATISADVSAASAMEAAVDQASRLLGGLDVVVANAGAASYGPFSDAARQDYHRTIAITLLGTLNTAHAAVGHLEQSRGTLIVVGSVAGRLPTPWLSAYTAAKHGVRGFVRSFAGELRAQGSPIRVALVAPGPVDTPFWRRARTPDGRLPPELRGAYHPDDVATEITRAILGAGKTERTVGGLMIPALVADAVFPNLTLRLVGVVAKLGWRKREQRSPSDEDALSKPVVRAEQEGGLASRRSILTKLRELVSIRR
ncbi:MAG: SDR family NAD(P)-dependent oxidoreductase [Solirubrobacterales bacterium]|nr:SDR family NAD(P)-dependent oxidoreductase [Solirubrobacterales bacterium]